MKLFSQLWLDFCAPCSTIFRDSNLCLGRQGYSNLAEPLELPQAQSVLAFPASQQMPEKHQASESTAHPGQHRHQHCTSPLCLWRVWLCWKRPRRIRALGLTLWALPPPPESSGAAPWGGGEQRGQLPANFPSMHLSSCIREASIFRLPVIPPPKRPLIAAVPPSTLELPRTFWPPESGGSWKTKSTGRKGRGPYMEGRWLWGRSTLRYEFGCPSWKAFLWSRQSIISGCTHFGLMNMWMLVIVLPVFYWSTCE